MAGLKNKTSTVVLGTAGISMALLIASGWLVGDDNPREFDTSYRPTATVEEAPFAAFVFMALFGMSNGVRSTLFGALWPEVYGTRPLGAVRSVTVSLMVLASAAGPGLTGWLIDLGVPYENQILAMALYCLLACGAMAVVSRRLVARAASGG